MIGGGLAGLSSAAALAEAGYRVTLLEQRPHLGGRATSYSLPDGEHVDNCQHVTLGCCTNLGHFYRCVGAAGKIRYYGRLAFASPHGRRGILKSSLLPPPLHLAPSFALFPLLTWPEKRAIARALFVIARAGGQPSFAPGTTMLDWLHRHNQPSGAIERFWRVVLVSALDEELDRTDARYGIDVFWKAFLSNRRGYEVGIPTVPLADLYDGCRDAILQRGGEVRTRAVVRAIRFSGARVASVVLDSGNELTADHYLSAVPHTALLDLLPPTVVDREPVFANLRRLETAPITGVHFWLDRPVLSEPFLTVLDCTTQWIFNKSLLFSASVAQALLPVHSGIAAGPPAPSGGAGTPAGDSSSAGARHGMPSPSDEFRVSNFEFRPSSSTQYLQLVISASRSLIPLSRQEIIDLCLRELREILPVARDARLLKATVIKEITATFSPTPGSDRLRPGQRTPIDNLFLAGDWTSTSWPATMEGAVRSGYLAAEAILSSDASPRGLLQPDLPSEGLARLCSRG